VADLKIIEQPLQFDAIATLAAALCDGTIDSQGFARLEQLLASDPAARRWYIDYMDLHDELSARHFGSVHGVAVPPGAAEEQAEQKAETKTDDSGAMNDRSPGTAPSARRSSFVIHHSSFSAGLLSSPLLSSPLLSYAIAVLMLAGGILGAWAWKVSDTQDAAARGQSSPLLAAQPLESGALPAGTAAAIVGRITAMVDCRWSDPRAAATDGAAVPLGRTYALASGILEIRYRSGPDVIVEGPALYEATSDRGGFLSRGRLTVRVEPRWDRNEDFTSLLQRGGSGFGVQGSESETAGFPASRPPSSVFVLRTPSANIEAPLGAEFGMEAEPREAVRAHVFYGHVTLKLAGVDNEAASGIRVGANQLARIGTIGHLPAVSVLPGGALPESFARRVFIHASPGPSAADQLDQLATGRWLKGIGAEWEGPLVAVGADENPPLPLREGHGVRATTSGPGLPAGVTYTYRTAFEVAGVLPGTAVVRVRFLAKGSASGFRFNGQSVSGPVFDDRKVRDAGYFIARRDRVRRLNTVEIDVTGRTPDSGDENLMLLGITVTGIRPPQQPASSAPVGSVGKT
jgi:hypothetical protein